LEQAKNYYRFLHRELFKNMQKGSLLLTCNCSSALSTSEFLNLVTYQAQPVGKQIRVLGCYGPASCHPILPGFPEGNYLTAILLAVV
jgi:23S rRNA (cytosine1962-C5)-methyltransferase